MYPRLNVYLYNLFHLKQNHIIVSFTWIIIFTDQVKMTCNYDLSLVFPLPKLK
jgi:hypothetical protein